MYKLLDDYGCYYVGFLTAELNMPFDGNTIFQELSEEDQATVMHEYIHYLQDITTVRGAKTFNHVVNFVRNAFAILSHSDDVTELPIRLSPELNVDSYLAYEFFSYYIGSTKFKQIHHINSVKPEENDIIKMVYKNHPDKVPKKMVDNYHLISVYYDDKEYPFYLGSDCIAESMAYLVENQLFNIAERKNQIPYNLCELIVKRRCPKNGISKTILVAICELSLMHENSGEMFFRILTEIKKKNLFFNSIDEFEHHFAPRTKKLFYPLNDLLAKTIKAIDFLYPERIPEMKGTNQYLKKCFQNGIMQRKQGLFIARMLEMNEADRDKEIEFWMKNLGMPAIINNRHEVFSFDDFDLIHYLAPLSLYNVFYENPKECFSYLICKEQSFPLFDEETCRICPWKQIEKENLCPFSLYLHRFGISPESIHKE